MQKMKARRWVGSERASSDDVTFDGGQRGRPDNVARNRDESGGCGLRNLLPLDRQKLAHAPARIAAGAVLFVRLLAVRRLVVMVRAAAFVLTDRLVRDDVASRAVIGMTPAAPQGAVGRHDN